MLYVPRHLPNKLEYKVLSCISVNYQLRMTSNGIAITSSRLHSTGRVMVLFKVAGYLTLRAGVVLCWGGCQQMCMLHAVVVLGVCLRETWTVAETFLNTR